MGRQAKPIDYDKPQWVVQGLYGHHTGWEDVAATDDYAEAKADYKAYRDNEPQYRHRLIKRRWTRNGTVINTPRFK